MWPLACAPFVSRHPLWHWVARRSPWAGFPPPFFFYLWLRGGVCGSRPCCVVALWYSPPPVPVLGSWSPSPVPLSFWLRLFFISPVAGGPPLHRWDLRRRVRGALSSGPSAVVWSWLAAAFGWVSPAGAGWSSSVLSGAPAGVAWLGRLPASCGVGVRLRGCVTVSRPPPFFFSLAGGRALVVGRGFPPSCVLCFFLGGGFLFLPLPSLGW